MANWEHLQVMHQGVEVWNQWRCKRWDITPDLSGAHFWGADLIGADLADTNLVRANLAKADLADANLANANLVKTSLIGADLIGADLSEAALWETIFSNTDLTDVRRLETCRHEGPSTLDHRTLAKSGPLPLAFLRGLWSARSIDRVSPIHPR
jgi:Pentapeptide repeats (8 copies)